MQEVNSLCTDSLAHRAEYCIVGIPHKTIQLYGHTIPFGQLDVVRIY